MEERSKKIKKTKILLYSNTNDTTTTTESVTLIQTSTFVKVNIEVEPNIIVQTSPLKFADEENMLINKYPRAKAPTEIIAIVASPLILEFWPPFKSITANNIVIGNTTNILFVKPKTVATAIAPKVTLERPSPINENLFKTRVAPNREEHREINTPTINAYLTKGYCI